MSKPLTQFVVYMATNTVNGKRYVGATKRGLTERKYQHIYDATKGRKGCRVFAAAIIKYGPESFQWSVLAQPESIDAMISEEIRLIAEMRPEYNITIGGRGVIGAPRTPEWLANMSKALMGRKGPKSCLGKSHSQETRDKISAAKKGKPNPSARELLKRDKSMIEASIKKSSKSVVCVNDGLRFMNIREASNHYGLSLSNSALSNAHFKIRRGTPINNRIFEYAGAPT